MSPGVTPGTDAPPLAWLEVSGRQRQEAGLRRSLRPRSPAAGTESGVLDLASNDYLGLSGHPAVIEAGVHALRLWGAG